MGFDFVLLIHPFIISIAILSEYKILYEIGLIELAAILFIGAQKIHFYLNRKNISVFLYVKDIIFICILFSSLFFLFGSQSNLFNETILDKINRNISVILIFLGVTSVVSTINFLEQHKLILEVSETFKYAWADSIQELNFKFERLERIFNRISKFILANKNIIHDKRKIKFHEYKDKYEIISKNVNNLSSSKISKYISYEEVILFEKNIQNWKTKIEMLTYDLNKEWENKDD